MIRKILAPISADGTGGSVLAYATTLAFQHNAHVEVVHCRAPTSSALPKGSIVPSFLRETISTQSSSVADAEERALRNQFEHFAQVLNLTLAEGPEANTPSTYWREQVGTLADVIKERGILADMIIVPKPTRDKVLGVTAVHAALFSTGTPVLMCPAVSKRPDSLGEIVTVAWNGSVQAARAIALNQDILSRAKSVTVLTAGHEIAHGAKAEDLIDYLALRGIKADLQRFEPKKKKIAQGLLQKCDELEADLMIMGAYSESHEREAFFGGNSQTIVDEAQIPIVMVH